MLLRIFVYSMSRARIEATRCTMCEPDDGQVAVKGTRAHTGNTRLGKNWGTVVLHLIFKLVCNT